MLLTHTTPHRVTELATMEPYIYYPTWMARELGISAAIVLSRLIYWEPKAKTEIEGQRWVYKSLDEWVEETGLSINKIRQAMRILISHELIEKSKLRAKQWYQICYYRIKHDSLELLEEQCLKRTNGTRDFVQIEPDQLNNSSIDPKNTNNTHSQNLTKSEAKIKSKRNKKEQRTEIPNDIVEPKISEPLSISSPDIQTSDVEISSALDLSQKTNNTVEPMLLQWLVSRAKRLGKNDPLSWAYVVAQSPTQPLWDEYQAFLAREALPQSEVPVTATVTAMPDCPPPPAANAVESSQEECLARLTAKWNIEAPRLRQRFREAVQQEIEAHPTWGLICDPESGPRIASEVEPVLSDLVDEPTFRDTSIPEMPVVESAFTMAEGGDDGPEIGHQLEDDFGDILAEVSNFFRFLQWGKEQIHNWLLAKFSQAELCQLSDRQLLQAHRALLVESLG